MYESKNLVTKINLNNKNQQKNNSFKKEDNEIIIELEIFNNRKENEINILCDKIKLINNNKENQDSININNLTPPKIFDYFNKANTKLFLNEKEIEFIIN